ncbi:MAG: hypothetical protein GY938_22910 [Ketobacter sp.]|nr:hypothetical protein [Ketobacter sp.]
MHKPHPMVMTVEAVDVVGDADCIAGGGGFVLERKVSMTLEAVGVFAVLVTFRRATISLGGFAQGVVSKSCLDIATTSAATVYQRAC